MDLVGLEVPDEWKKGLPCDSPERKLIYLHECIFGYDLWVYPEESL